MLFIRQKTKVFLSSTSRVYQNLLSKRVTMLLHILVTLLKHYLLFPRFICGKPAGRCPAAVHGAVLSGGMGLVYLVGRHHGQIIA